MARGVKLDLDIGANFNDTWSEVESKKNSTQTNQILEPKKHQLFFKKEKRRGKTVTLIGEFQLSKEVSTTLLKKIKKQLGCGGSYKNNWMEFQGEVKEKARELLVKEEFRFKHGH